MSAIARLISALTLALSLVAIHPAHADPLQLAVQGRLTSQAGSAVADGNYAMGVVLYDVATGGAPVWSESFLAVPVQGGVFGVTLGAALAKLDSAVFAEGKPLWLAVTVGADPELPRQQLLRVPFAVQAQVASMANDLQCSGCVATDDLAKGAVTGDKLANGAVGANHVNFAWAAAESPGGAATYALGANTAKLADVATLAEQAKQANTAAFADEAAVAQKAKDLQCTGCVGATAIAGTVPADWVAGGKLAKVATSGNYADLNGGPDLSGYGALTGANTWTKSQTLQGGGALGNALNFNANEAQLLKLQNADKDPIACGATTVGVIYYNTAKASLMVCNGKDFAAFAYAVALGDAKNPGVSCQNILEKTGNKVSGLYWIDPNGGSAADAVQVYCDMVTDGGGWTKVMSAQYKFFFDDTNWMSYAVGAPMDGNYSILNLRDFFKAGSTYTFRYQVGDAAAWNTGAVTHHTEWQQDHDPFTATTAGADFKLVGGESSTTCGGFNGLHNKYLGHSYASDPDSNDPTGCWWMQVVPRKDYNGLGYLNGYGGSGHYSNWQVLWMR